MRTKYIVMAFLGLFVTSAFSGCIETDMVTEDFSGEYNANENTTLTVFNSNGDIKINTNVGDTVKLDGEKKVSEDKEDLLDKTEVEVTEGNTSITIETVYEDPKKKDVTVNMDISVPEYVDVMSVRTSNGDIMINDVNGHVSVSTSNGDVEVMGTEGVSDISSSNGNVKVEVHDFKEDISISSSNGNIVVYILPTLNATIDMVTSNGKISISGVTLDKSLDDDKHKTGKLNGGGFKINIHTSNGNVDLKKRD